MFASLHCMSKSLKPFVLVVEDETMIRWIAIEGLEDAGYQVLDAANAQDALAILGSRSDVGVLFTDVNMPGRLDGLQLAELVHAKWPDISLIVTSARGLDRAVPDDGDFLSKPYSVEEITSAVAKKSRSSPR